MCHVPPCGRAAPSPAATPPLHRIARSAALLLWRRCSALSLLLRTRNHAPSCPPSLQLLFRTINRDLGHPNANDDYIASMFRCAVCQLRHREGPEFVMAALGRHHTCAPTATAHAPTTRP